MKNLVSLGVFLLILLSVQVNAQEQSVLQIRPTGRILMDGGLFHSDNKNFVDGVAIPDARIGVKATYGKYKAKVDIGLCVWKGQFKRHICRKTIFLTCVITCREFCTSVRASKFY